MGRSLLLAVVFTRVWSEPQGQNPSHNMGAHCRVTFYEVHNDSNLQNLRFIFILL